MQYKQIDPRVFQMLQQESEKTLNQNNTFRNLYKKLKGGLQFAKNIYDSFDSLSGYDMRNAR